MPAAVVCSSHAPLMLCEETSAPQKRDFLGKLTMLGRWVEGFAPDVIIEFAPDHFNGFFYDAMPNFCLGLAAVSVGDWKTSAGPLNVPKELVLAAAQAIRDADIDVDISHRMSVDHGFTQILELMFGSLTTYPVIPVMINCAAPPLPTFRRARLLGEALGRFARGSGLRVLFVGSGGLSHDPPIPKMEEADEKMREFMIAGRNVTAEARELRENRVVSAGLKFAQGEKNCLAPDPAWDRAFIELMRSADLARVDEWSEQEITHIGGCGAHEVRTWIAAFAALSAAVGNHYETVTEFCQVVPQWMTGMGIVRAHVASAESIAP
jgi:2,3-dihydroxyphenylpropionate 1,2-dioxygenase